MGTRTPDLLIANETLYQLSYTPKLIDFNELHGNLPSKKDGCLYRHRPMKANGILAPPSGTTANFSKYLRMSLV